MGSSTDFTLQVVSYTSEEHVDASELDESEEVFNVELPSGDESPEVVHPGEEPFYLPSLFVATKFSPVLCFAAVQRFGAIISTPYSFLSCRSSSAES